jgi:hypothetical protein
LQHSTARQQRNGEHQSTRTTWLDRFFLKQQPLLPFIFIFLRRWFLGRHSNLHAVSFPRSTFSLQALFCQQPKIPSTAA